jgi:hypothetical protein
MGLRLCARYGFRKEAGTVCFRDNEGRAFYLQLNSGDAYILTE